MWTNGNAPLALAPPYAPIYLNLTSFPSSSSTPGRQQLLLIVNCVDPPSVVLDVYEALYLAGGWQDETERLLLPLQMPLRMSASQLYRLPLSFRVLWHTEDTKAIEVMSHRNSHTKHLMTNPVLTRDIIV